MNILMVTMSLGIGGAETHILELTRELIHRGHSVTVASSGGIFVPAFLEAGARHIDVPLHTKRPDALAKAYRILSRNIRRENYDVIHAHARIPGFIASLLAKQHDVPMVTTFHGTFNPVWYWRMLTRVGERTLAVSEDIKEYLMHYYGTPEEKIALTVNGIDTAQFDTADPGVRAEVEKELSLPAGHRIMAVTRLDQASAAHIFPLIEAMPAILSHHPDAVLTVVGGGDAIDSVRAEAEAMNRQLGEEKITVTGPRSDISRILAAADSFVGVSRAAMEAMACRIPVVLSGAQGHLGVFVSSMEAEAVETNFCCRTREPADTRTMAHAVISLLSLSAEQRQEMGEFNRCLVGRLYSVGRMAGDAEELYRSALREHKYRRADVVISGYYGFCNAGDDALLSHIADGLRARGIRRIAALAKKGSDPAAGVRAVSRFHVLAVLRTIRKAKLLISGGGSLLQDATSTKSLWYYTTVIRAAKRAGVPVMILANGIGPIRKPSNRRRAAEAVRLADYVSVRENASARELTDMGIPAERIRVTADPVYRSSDEPVSRTDNGTLVLSLRETADGRDSSGIENTAVQALTEICRSYSLTAVILPMQPSYDREICARAAARLAESGVEVTLAGDADREEMQKILRQARVVVGMRLHSLIFATAAGVPSLALSYDPKLDALMEYLGMEEYVLPAFETDAGELKKALSDLLSRREEVTAALRQRTGELSRLAEADLEEALKLMQ